MRCGGRCAIASSRFRGRARGARTTLRGASAWISSMMTNCTDRSVSARLRREHEVQRLGSGDEDVGGSAQGGLARAALGVPVRSATLASWNPVPSRSAASAIPRSGDRRSSRCRRRARAAARCRAPGQRSPLTGTGSPATLSIAQRNAASVFARAGRRQDQGCGRRRRSPANALTGPPWARRRRRRPGLDRRRDCHEPRGHGTRALRQCFWSNSLRSSAPDARFELAGSQCSPSLAAEAALRGITVRDGGELVEDGEDGRAWVGGRGGGGRRSRVDGRGGSAAGSSGVIEQAGDPAASASASPAGTSRPAVAKHLGDPAP